MKPHKHAAVIKAWADGAKIECQHEKGGPWVSVTYTPQWHENFQYHVKPAAPEVVYPETLITDADLYATWVGRASLRALVNTALRHAIDAGQVRLPASPLCNPDTDAMRIERAERALRRAGFEKRDGEEWQPPIGPVGQRFTYFVGTYPDPARELAIAEAVCRATRNSAHLGRNEVLWEPIELSDIIATIK